MKSALAAIVGYAVWTALWLGGNAGFRALGILSKDQTVKVEKAGPLLALLVLSVIASMAGGYVCGRMATTRMPPFICAALLLATGVAVQWGFRALFPVWYHGAFLLLLMPVFLLGSGLAKRS